MRRGVRRASHHPAEFRPGKRCVASLADDRIHSGSAPCAALIVGLTRVHAQTRAANQMQILTPKPASHRTMLPVKTGPPRTAPIAEAGLRFSAEILITRISMDHSIQANACP